MGYVQGFVRSRATGQIWEPATIESETLGLCSRTLERFKGMPVVTRQGARGAVYYAVPCGACGGKGQAMLDGVEAVTCAACGGP